MTTQLKQVPLKLLTDQDLRPLVSLRRKLSDFARENSFDLIRDHDDLDEYSALAVCGSVSAHRGSAGILFALKSYTHDAAETMDLLLPETFIRDAGAPNYIIELAAQLGADEDDILWPKVTPPAWGVALDRQEIIIGEGVAVSGEIKDAGRIVIAGTLESKSLFTEQLKILRTGVFKGDVWARDIEVAGSVFGAITAADHLIIRSTGRVFGTVSYRALVVEDSARISGVMQTLPGAKQAEQEIQSAAREEAVAHDEYKATSA